MRRQKKARKEHLPAPQHLAKDNNDDDNNNDSKPFDATPISHPVRLRKVCWYSAPLWLALAICPSPPVIRYIMHPCTMPPANRPCSNQQQLHITFSNFSRSDTCLALHLPNTS